jgi:DNA-binding transcriptional ArsR family regulator
MTQERDSLSDPKAMRALAHSARLSILNKLGVVGSATATEVAADAGITPSAASYHLRMLAKYGFVEDAPARGDGRERVWKPADKPLSVGVEPDDQPEVREAKYALIRALRREADEEAERLLANTDRETPEWREAISFSRTLLKITAAEMAQLDSEIGKLVEPYIARRRSEESTPDGARIAEAQVNLFPHVRRAAQGLPTEDHDAE